MLKIDLTLLQSSFQIFWFKFTTHNEVMNQTLTDQTLVENNISPKQSDATDKSNSKTNFSADKIVVAADALYIQTESLDQLTTQDDQPCNSTNGKTTSKRKTSTKSARSRRNSSKSITGVKRKYSDLEKAELMKVEEIDFELSEFKCPRCDEIFKTTNDLFGHMREKHENPTKCHVCGKQMNAMANLLSHSYIHTGERPYKCPNCDYTTRTRFNLKVHFGSCAEIDKFSYRRSTIRTAEGKRKKTSAVAGVAYKRKKKYSTSRTSNQSTSISTNNKNARNKSKQNTNINDITPPDNSDTNDDLIPIPVTSNDNVPPQLDLTQNALTNNGQNINMNQMNQIIYGQHGHVQYPVQMMSHVNGVTALHLIPVTSNITHTIVNDNNNSNNNNDNDDIDNSYNNTDVLSALPDVSQDVNHKANDPDRDLSCVVTVDVKHIPHLSDVLPYINGYAAYASYAQPPQYSAYNFHDTQMYQPFQLQQQPQIQQIQQIQQMQQMQQIQQQPLQEQEPEQQQEILQQQNEQSNGYSLFYTNDNSNIIELANDQNTNEITNLNVNNDSQKYYNLNQEQTNQLQVSDVKQVDLTKSDDKSENQYLMFEISNQQQLFEF